MVTQTSTITCPHCGLQQRERMPADRCEIAYHCRGCGATMRPLAGDCGIYCSFGSVPCPAIQQRRARQPRERE